jgi:hypothetical protein
MKKAICVGMALICAAAMAGCQKSPESPIVIGKNVDTLIDMATESGSGAAQTPVPEGVDYRAILAEKLGVPERFVTNESYSDGRLTLTADARIVLPNVAALPVMRVEPADFPQELVDKLYGCLIGDTPMYRQQMRYTKAQIEEDLVMWRQILGNPNSAADSRAQAEEKIAELEAAYGSAPDSPALIPADATIGTQQEIDFQSGRVMCEYSGVDLAEVPGIFVQQGKIFSVRNNTEDGEIVVEENVGGWTVTDTASQGACFYYSDNDLTPKACYVTVETVTPDSLTDRPDSVSDFSYEDALAMAQDFLDAAGVEDMQVRSITLTFVLPEPFNSTIYGIDVKPQDRGTVEADIRNGKYDADAQDVRYKLELARTVNGIPVTSDGSSSYIGDAMFGAQWFYESFSIEVCSGGISNVSWSSPHKITETVTEDAALRSFAEIAEIFDNMYRVTYDASGSNLAGEVSRVTLTLRRIMEQNNIGYGLFVPVWDFYGSMIISYPDYPEEPPQEWMSGRPLLTINGIDGTVIDLDRGY